MGKVKGKTRGGSGFEKRLRELAGDVVAAAAREKKAIAAAAELQEKLGPYGSGILTFLASALAADVGPARAMRLLRTVLDAGARILGA